jgi:hypothetical protein
MKLKQLPLAEGREQPKVLSWALIKAVAKGEHQQAGEVRWLIPGPDESMADVTKVFVLHLATLRNLAMGYRWR